MKINLLLFFLLILQYSCNDNVSNSKIGNYIAKTCNDEKCDIKLSDIIKEPWDTVFLFDQNSSLDFIRNTIKLDYEFVDIGRKIIFIKGKDIVYCEDEFPNPEKTKTNELLFSIGQNSVLKIPRENAIFYVEKENDHFIIKHKTN